MLSLDVECVLIEEVQCPRKAPVLNATLERQEPPVVESENRTGDQREKTDEAVFPGFESDEASNEVLGAGQESVGSESKDIDLSVEVLVLKPIPIPRRKRETSTQLNVPCPEPRRTQSSTAGVYTN